MNPSPPRLRDKFLPRTPLACIMVNQFFTPGLGSVLSRRFISGTGQLLLAFGGCGMVIVWFIGLMVQQFQLINDQPVDEKSHSWLMKVGFILFGISWAWAGITSIGIYREEQWKREAELKAPPRLN